MEQTASELAVLLEGQVVGNPETRVRKLAKIESAGPGSCFFVQPEYERFLYSTAASVVIVAEDFQPSKALPSALTLLRVADPYRAFARLFEAYDEILKRQEGCMPRPLWMQTLPSVRVASLGLASSSSVALSLATASNCTPTCTLAETFGVGQDTTLQSGVRVLDRCLIGQRCNLQAGAVIGADGFGFAPQEDGSHAKVPQTGNVVIEDNCDIGALTTIDRATLGSTVIRKGCNWTTSSKSPTT